VEGLLVLLRRSPIRAAALLFSVALVSAGIAFLASGETFAGGWLLAMGLLTAPLNAYRLYHRLPSRSPDPKAGKGRERPRPE
jgi:hypothetical protein